MPRGRRFDVFHSPFEFTPRGLTRPLVVTIHDINWIVNPSYNSNNFFMRRAGGFFYRNSLIAAMNNAARIIAISNATRNAIIEFAPWHEKKIRVVYNGIDRTRIFPLDGEAATRALHGWIDPASLRPHGRPGLPIQEPFLRRARLSPGVPRSARVPDDSGAPGLGGDWALDRLLASPQATAQIRTLPYVTTELLNALYNRARIVLHPSYYEGFGLPLVEAMAAGVPVVTSTVSSMPEIVGPAAVLVSPADVDAIAGALRRLDQDELLRERLIAAGHEQLGRFDPARDREGDPGDLSRRRAPAGDFGHGALSTRRPGLWTPAGHPPAPGRARSSIWIPARTAIESADEYLEMTEDTLAPNGDFHHPATRHSPRRAG